MEPPRASEAAPLCEHAGQDRCGARDGTSRWEAGRAFFSNEGQLKSKFSKEGLSFSNIDSAEPATVSKYFIN